jgi:hypothetical protein
VPVGLPRHGGSGGTRTHKGLATLTCFRDRSLIWPDRFRLAGTNRTCDPAFGGRCSRPLSYGELSVDGRGRTCTLRFRRPVPSPFGHVDVAPPTGLEPVTFCSTGSCSGRLSYGGLVRALGLEPSLVRGKSPVPYLSGVTRVVGREGIEPLCRKTAGLQPAATHGATDPCRSQVALASTTMSLQLSRCWCPDWLPGASKQARKESNLRSSVLETATPPWLEPRWNMRMTLCA